MPFWVNNMQQKRRFDLKFEPKILYEKIRDRNLQRFTSKEIPFSLFNQVYNQLQDLMEPLVVWDIFKIVERKDDKFILDNGNVIGSGPLTDVMKEANKIALGIATLGNIVDTQIKIFKEQKNSLRFRLFDSLASWVVGEGFKNKFCSWFNHEMNQNQLYTSILLLPGSTGWIIDDNKIIFDLIDASKYNLQINEDNFMKPVKTISFGIGISPNSFEKGSIVRCELCDRKETCPNYYAKKEDLIVIF